MILTVQGEIDIATVDTLSARLTEVLRAAGDVTVDLRRVAFSTASACAAAPAHDRSAPQGPRVDFVQGPPAVRRLFEPTGTLDRLDSSRSPPRRLASTG